MIERYSRLEMTALWSEQRKFETWLEVEILACEAWAQKKVIPKKAVEAIRKRARIDVKRILEIEEIVRHDVIAFTTQLAEKIGPDSRYVHLGLTSSDVVDTAQAVRMMRAADLLMEEVRKVQMALVTLARTHAWTVMMGRTHGMHAEPTTFGLKCLLWLEEFRRQEQRLTNARRAVAVGKISGAVGTFAHTGTHIERYVCRRLGIEPAKVSNQVIQRDRHAEFLSAIANVAASIEKIATEIRHLQRPEVAELQEPFGRGQKGSSAMPHKRNPVRCEQLTGLARVLRANALPAFENIALWHERDISHSSVERVILPDSCIGLDYMLDSLRKILEGLVVRPEAMLKNLHLSRGVVFSGRVLVELVQKGMSREDAYAAVQKAAMRTWDGGDDFATEIRKEPEVQSRISQVELANIMDPASYLNYVPEIYKRCGVAIPERKQRKPPKPKRTKKPAAKRRKS